MEKDDISKGFKESLKYIGKEYKNDVKRKFVIVFALLLTLPLAVVMVQRVVNYFSGAQVVQQTESIVPLAVESPTATPSGTLASPTPTTDPQTPFTGTPFDIPGIIQTEDFDNGGEGIAYHDLTAANEGGGYRLSEGVDIATAFDTTGAFLVGWTNANEWLEYTVNVTQSGPYTLETRFAAQGGGGQFHVEMDGTNLTGTLDVPNTGGWQTWQTLNTPGVDLTAGAHIMRVFIDKVGQSGYAANINYFNFTSETPIVSPTPTSNLISPSFQIRFQGIPPTSGFNSLAKQVTLTFVQPQTSIVQYQFQGLTFIPDSLGIYTGALTGIEGNTYDIYIKEPTHLQKRFSSIPIVGTSPLFDLTGFALLAGDFDSSNVINIVDIASLLSQYTQLSTPVNSNNRIYDANSDDVINIIDVSVVLANYTALNVPGDSI